MQFVSFIFVLVFLYNLFFTFFTVVEIILINFHVNQILPTLNIFWNILLSFYGRGNDIELLIRIEEFNC